MKILVLIALSFLLLQTNGLAEEVVFIDGPVATAFKKGRRESKLIFVNFYASGSAPCTQMNREVFADKRVADFFNANFVSLKIDAENPKEVFTERMRIQSIPTLIFFDPAKKVLIKVVGAQSSEELIALGQSVLDYQRYRDTDVGLLRGKELNNYLRILKEHYPEKARTLALNALKEYTSNGYRDENSWFLMKHFVSDMDHPAFQAYINDAKWFDETFKDAADLFANVFQAEMSRMISELKPYRLYMLSKTEIGWRRALGILEYPDDYYFRENRMIYLHGIGDTSSHLKELEAWVNDYYKNDLSRLILEAETLLKYSDPLKRTLAAKFVERAYSLSKEAKVVILYAYTTYKVHNQKEKAIIILQDAIHSNEHDESEKNAMQGFLELVIRSSPFFDLW